AVNDLQEYFIHEFVTEYKQGHMSRRDMIRRVMYIMGGVASTATLLSAMGCGGQQLGRTPAPATKAVEKPVVAASASPSPIATSAAAASPSPAAAASPSPVARSPLSVPANDPSIDMADITFPGEAATIMAYQAKPKGDGPFPLVLVCEQNRG